MKICGLVHGQFGDMAANSVVCRVIKETYPGSHMTLGIAERYAGCQEAFLDHSHIDAIRIWEGYDDFPTVNDKKFIQEGNFDRFLSPRASHKQHDWFKRKHIIQSFCEMYDLPEPDDLQIRLTPRANIGKLSQYKDYVAISCFTGAEKALSVVKLNAIIAFIHNMGLKTIQLGAPDEPSLVNTERLDGASYFHSIEVMTSCRMLLCVDTGMNWYASGYQQRVVSLYSYGFFRGAETAKNCQPVNPNAIYLEGVHANDICNSHIEEAIIKQL